MGVSQCIDSRAIHAHYSKLGISISRSQTEWFGVGKASN